MAEGHEASVPQTAAQNGMQKAPYIYILFETIVLSLLRPRSVACTQALSSALISMGTLPWSSLQEIPRSWALPTALHVFQSFRPRPEIVLSVGEPVAGTWALHKESQGAGHLRGEPSRVDDGNSIVLLQIHEERGVVGRPGEVLRFQVPQAPRHRSGGFMSTRLRSDGLRGLCNRGSWQRSRRPWQWKS